MMTTGEPGAVLPASSSGLYLAPRFRLCVGFCFADFRPKGAAGGSGGRTAAQRLWLWRHCEKGPGATSAVSWHRRMPGVNAV